VDAGAQAEPLLRAALRLEDPRWPPSRLRWALLVRASLATVRAQTIEGLQLHRRLYEADRAAGEPGLTALINIANTELMSGDAAAAVATGTRLLALLRDGRHGHMLQHASFNLAAAHLALGQAAPARQALRPLLQGAPRARLPAWCLDVLALLAALEGRSDAAAQLLGAADARYVATDDRRQANEEAARTRTLQLLRAVQGEAALAELAAQGSTLGEAELRHLALQA